MLEMADPVRTADTNNECANTAKREPANKRHLTPYLSYPRIKAALTLALPLPLALSATLTAGWIASPLQNE
jgi:hypothetical protein